MFYCKARSDGESLDNSNFIDFDKLSRIAEQAFLAEQKAPEEAALDLRLNTELTSSELKAPRRPRA
jgi:hypothetical protein